MTEEQDPSRRDLLRSVFLGASGFAAGGVFGFTVGSSKSGSSPSPTPEISPSPTREPTTNEVEFAISVLELTNVHRKLNRLEPLKAHHALVLGAQNFAQVLAQKDWTPAFTQSDVPLEVRLAAVGFHLQDGDIYDEVVSIGEGTITTEQIIRELLDNPQIQASLLNEQFHYTGVGCFGKGLLIWCVQYFASNPR